MPIVTNDQFAISTDHFMVLINRTCVARIILVGEVVLYQRVNEYLIVVVEIIGESSHQSALRGLVFLGIVPDDFLLVS